MKNPRSTLLTLAVVYAIYSIGRGFWGISQTQGPAGKGLLLLGFAALLAASVFLIYKLHKQEKK